jgi:hypothetical protein
MSWSLDSPIMHLLLDQLAICSPIMVSRGVSTSGMTQYKYYSLRSQVMAISKYFIYEASVSRAKDICNNCVFVNLRRSISLQGMCRCDQPSFWNGLVLFFNIFKCIFQNYVFCFLLSLFCLKNKNKNKKVKSNSSNMCEDRRPIKSRTDQGFYIFRKWMGL